MSKGLIEDYLEDERRRMMVDSMRQSLLAASPHNVAYNPAQNMLTTTTAGIGAQNIASAQGASLGQSGMHKERGVVGDFRIEQVHGGFIVCIGREPYGPAERHIAITMEDVSRIVLSQLTSSMLEKT